jgi:glycosyltransferase involved in cell wall biosynthesis
VAAPAALARKLDASYSPPVPSTARSPQEPVRIVHLPTGTGGHPFGLSRAERALGFRSDVADFTPNYTGYGADRVFDLSGRSAPARAAVRLRFIAEAARSYDVFHFNSGAPGVALRTHRGVFTELPMLRRLGKIVVVTWQGCDVRPRAACPWCERPECLAHGPWREADAKAMLKHADRAVFLNPDLGRYLPGATFLPYASVDVGAIEPRPLPDRGTIVVAHAPTNRPVKGTAYVTAAVEALRAEGVDVEIDLITGVTNREAMDRIAQADVLVDQLHLGWYGSVAVEAMALGRPVVCFIEESENPYGSALPIVRAGAETLKDVLAELIADRVRRATLAERGRVFALREHDPRSIVRRYYAGLVRFPPERAV